MAKIDKFLQVMVSRGASLLRLDPGDPPMVELPGGHRATLSGQELLGTVVDGIAKEILPEGAPTTAFMRGEKVTFDYRLDGSVYQVLCCRTSLGTRLVAARFGSPAPEPVAGAQAAPDNLDALIIQVLNQGGSDLCLNSEGEPLARLGGQLQALAGFGPISGKRLEDLVRGWVSPGLWETFSAGQDVEFSLGSPELPCRLRVNLFHDPPGLSLAVRLIPRQVPDADTLGLSDAVRRLAALNKGLVVLTGPMGSGKSTTLACLLNLANAARKGYLVTVQDSVEFDFPKAGCLIRQRETGGDPQRQLQCLRAALRQAPEILAVGELRDAAVLDLALQAAQSGCLVLATLSTTTLQDTLSCLAETCLPQHRARHLGRLGECLKAVVGHTLLPQMGGGQVVAMETLFNHPALAALLREDRLSQLPAVLKQGRYGNLTHNDALVQLVLNRRVEPGDAYQRCQDRESYIAACKKAGLPFDPRGSGEVTPT
jgi:twitching motility protein PilT